MFNLPGLRLMTDASAAAWVEEALARWPQGEGFTVGSLIPAGFEAYARILHPIRRVEGDVGTARWADLARERGKRMHPLVSFEALVGGRDREEIEDWDDLVPLEELPEREAIVLATHLGPLTADPDRCWFALWNGYGSFGPPGGYSYVVEPDGSWLVQDDTRADARAFFEELARYPLVRTLWSRSQPSFPGREYLLFHGSLDALESFHLGIWWQPPNLWWPDDRAWFVATEIDGYDTFVGGSRRCIEAVVASPDLEALPIDADAWFGPSDPWNPAPWDRSMRPLARIRPARWTLNVRRG
ncbi:MAG: hypothetical protein ACRDH7_12385 [Actinomycetota bacterium]